MGDDPQIRQLQEAQVFTERAVEELSGEVRDLSRRIVELAATLARLEARVNQSLEGDAESDQE